MRFARKFRTIEEMTEFRRRVANNLFFDTFAVGGVLVLYPKGQIDTMNGWATMEGIPQDIPLYGIWF